MQRVGGLPDGQTIYATCFHDGCLVSGVPGNECIDCFVLLLGEPLDSKAMDVIARELARANNDWVHVLGPGSESLHDAIDRMSVLLSRQMAVGDGCPMTSWHDELTTVDDMADFIALGGHGSAADLVVIVVGDNSDLNCVTSAMERQLSERPAS